MIGLIGGTGLGDALFGETPTAEKVIETPFGMPSSPIRIMRWSGLDVAVVARHGDGHTIPPSRVPYRANVFALKTLGVTHLLVSGAVGSLREEIAPRELVVVDQVIDRTYRRVPTFFDEGVAVHAEMSEPYCAALRARLTSAASAVDARVHPRGTYVCIEGPEFSTKAEAEMHRTLGADVVGMTAFPEARLAREASMCCALVALSTDYDCWRPHPAGTTKAALVAEIMSHLHTATTHAVALLRAVLEDAAKDPLGDCACQRALELGIWTRPEKIRPEIVDRYGPLLAKYLAR